MSFLRRGGRPVQTEYERRAALPAPDLERELAEWLERHPEMRDADRFEQLAAWLRATD